MESGAERSTRARILEVAENSLAERGFDGTRLHQIAERVGIQKASLFHYFASKADLYRAVLDQGFGETEQLITAALAAEGAPLDKVRWLIEAYVDVVASHPQRTKILLRQSLGDAPGDPATDGSQRLLYTVTAFVEDAQRAGLLAPIDPMALVLGVVGMVAFFLTSAPVLARDWIGDPASAASIARVKQHVVEVVERCLRVTPMRRARASASASAA